MRWDDLFRDLEGQLEAAERAELEEEVADRTRRETALVRLADRLRAAVGHDVVVHVAGAGALSGRLLDVGAEWLLLRERPDGETLVPATAVLGITGLGARTAAPLPSSALLLRLGLGHALRGVARSRLPVRCCLIDGTVVTGTLDRVGADFVELAEHGPGESRRHGAVRNVRAVPFTALGAIRG